MSTKYRHENRCDSTLCVIAGSYTVISSHNLGHRFYLQDQIHHRRVYDTVRTELWKIFTKSSASLL